jgi:dihydrofolate reductase
MKAILACDLSGGIGHRGKLPWPKIPGDLARFSRLTAGYPVIMGRGTAESRDMPMPLPGRTNVVISKTISKVPPGVIVLQSTEDAVKQYPLGWIIGGAEIFTAMLEHLTQIELTLVKNVFECDRQINLEQVRKMFCLVKNEECSNHAFQSWEKR